MRREYGGQEDSIQQNVEFLCDSIQENCTPVYLQRRYIQI